MGGENGEENRGLPETGGDEVVLGFQGGENLVHPVN